MPELSVVKIFEFSKQVQTLSLPSATKLRRFCFYRCLSVHGGGGGIPAFVVDIKEKYRSKSKYIHIQICLLL